MRKHDKTGPADAARHDPSDATADTSAVAAAAGGVSLAGTSGPDSLEGGPGDDTLIGRRGDDTLDGADGNDSISAGPGNDVITGGTGSDTIFGAAGADSIEVAGSDNVVSAGPGADTVTGSAGDDTLEGDGGADDISGGAGNDFLSGGSGSDTIDGGAGDDTIFGNPGNDSLIGGDGDDFLSGAGGNDTLSGGAGADTLIGGSGIDSFTDLGPGDSIIGGAGGPFDLDILDLTDAASDGGSFDITNVTFDSDGNGLDGQVIFSDASGAVEGTLTFENIEIFIACFTPGTLIGTETGMRQVETLREGDRIITRDNGLQELRWIGTKQLDRATLTRHLELRPVLIRAGALGNNLPEADMLVSPNHRMLVTGDKPALYFHENEVLAAAKHLVNGTSIVTADVLGVSYIHFMFDRHEVVLSNGTWSESFQPGPRLLRDLDAPQRAEIMHLFPELNDVGGASVFEPSRPVLKRHEAQLLRR